MAKEIVGAGHPGVQINETENIKEKREWPENSQQLPIPVENQPLLPGTSISRWGRQV